MAEPSGAQAFAASAQRLQGGGARVLAIVEETALQVEALVGRLAAAPASLGFDPFAPLGSAAAGVSPDAAADEPAAAQARARRATPAQHDAATPARTRRASTRPADARAPSTARPGGTEVPARAPAAVLTAPATVSDLIRQVMQGVAAPVASPSIPAARGVTQRLSPRAPLAPDAAAGLPMLPLAALTLPMTALALGTGLRSAVSLGAQIAALLPSAPARAGVVPAGAGGGFVAQVVQSVLQQGQVRADAAPRAGAARSAPAARHGEEPATAAHASTPAPARNGAPAPRANARLLPPDARPAQQPRPAGGRSLVDGRGTDDRAACDDEALIAALTRTLIDQAWLRGVDLS